jgi:surfactin synthase thioesterase subunit
MPNRKRPWRPAPGWLPDVPSRHARAVLFCLPYPGFGASMYGRWPQAVDGVDICPIQLPGRENRAGEDLHGSYAELADELADALVPYLDRPYGFFGHGPAALIGYEVTVRLGRPRAPRPRRLCVSAQAAPHHGPHDRLSRMSPAQRRALFGRMTERLHSGPSLPARDACLRILPADLTLLRYYLPIAPVELACPIIAIGWSRDDQVDPASMRGWAECGPTSFVVLDGGHDSVMDPPGALIDLLRRGLAPEATPFVRG